MVSIAIRKTRIGFSVFSVDVNVDVDVDVDPATVIGAGADLILYQNPRGPLQSKL